MKDLVPRICHMPDATWGPEEGCSLLREQTFMESLLYALHHAGGSPDVTHFILNNLVSQVQESAFCKVQRRDIREYLARVAQTGFG